MLKNRMNIIIRDQAKRMKAKIRKLVTGDENVRVRDHLAVHQEEPEYVKFFDKISFTLGVLNIIACQYFLVTYPIYFSMWYSAVIPILMVARFQYFRKKNWQYFLFDFCYFNLLLSFLLLYYLKESSAFFKVFFIFSNGPVAWAIVVWRASLVFHDFDKMTSLYIHILPSMLTYCIRWHMPNASILFQPMSVFDMIGSTLMYIFWQSLYFLKTEVIDKDKLNKNPQMLTSLRYLAADTKNATAKSTLSTCRKLGIMKPNENFDSTSIKTKLIFISTQFIYTISTFISVPFIYNSSTLHLIFIGMLFTISTYYGASFYIEVFSERYLKQFERQQHIERIAKAAVEIAYEVAQERGDNVNTGDAEALGSTSRARSNDGDSNEKGDEPSTLNVKAGTTCSFSTSMSSVVVHSHDSPATVEELIETSTDAFLAEVLGSNEQGQSFPPSSPNESLGRVHVE